MALRTCIDCKKNVSTSAKSCPHCGALPPKPQSLGCTGVMGIIAIVAFIFAIFGTNTQKSNPPQKGVPSSALPVEARQKYLDAFVKNPDDVLTRLSTSIKNEEWNKAITIAEYYLPTGHPEIVRLYAIAKKGQETTTDAPPQILKTSNKTSLSKISPKSACSFLDRLGFKTQGWGELASGDYGCPSEEIELGRENALHYKNNIRYYVTSDGTNLTELKIFLNISDLSQSESAKQTLLKSTSLLFEKLKLGQIPSSVEKAIKSDNSIKINIQGFDVSVQKMNWENNKNYSIKVVIH